MKNEEEKREGEKKNSAEHWFAGERAPSSSLRTERYGVNCDPTKARGGREKFDGGTVERELSDSR